MEVRLPRLGEGADSGIVASIFVKEGDQVKKEQPILELESEKAVASIPSPASGTVSKLYVKEGDQIKVGALILSLTEEGVVAPPPVPRIDASVGDEEEENVSPTPVAVSPGLQGVTELSGPAEAPFTAQGPPAASPSIRKMARELGIDLSRVRGSERGGRIVLADVRRYLQSLQKAVQQTQVSAAPQVDFAKWGSVERKKMTTIRTTISNRMVASWTTIPHITQFDEADVTEVLALQKEYAARYEKQKAHLTLTAFVLKAIVPVLKKYQQFNASIDEGTQEIIYKNYIHIGIAVDTEQGLIVPVIRNVDRKSLLEIARELNELAERARQRKIALEEMQGGSFTISNQGGIGSGHFTPIVNKPEVAILGLGRGLVKMVVMGKQVQRRTMLPLSLSYDHRIIDGADAARFMVDLVQAFENFEEADVKI